MQFKSLRARIAVTYLVLIALVMGALTWYVLGFVRNSYIAQLQEQLISEARLIGDMSRDVFAAEDSAAAVTLAQRQADLVSARVTLIDAQGVVIADSVADASTMLNHLHRPEIVAARTSGVGIEQRYSDTLNYNALYVAVPNPPEDPAPAYVRLAVPLRAIDAKVTALRRRILGATGLLLGAVLILGVALAEKTARPIRQLTSVVRRAAEGDLSVRLVARTQDEVGTLTRDLISMVEALQGTIDDLGRQRSQAAAILEHMADGIVITDAQGAVQLINPAGERILGVREGDAVGRSLAHVAREEGIIRALRSCLSDQQEQSEIVDLADTGITVELIASPVADESGDGRCLLVLRDVARLRQLERTRREFVSNISHELRTPIAGLRALVDTLRDGAIDDPPAAAHFLERMDVNVSELTQTVEALLQLAQVESGQAQMRLERVTVQELVEPALERMQPAVEQAGLELQTDLAADLPPVLADRSQISIVMSNLLQNACKFTPAGGRIYVDARAEGDMVRITVRDTGIGVSAEAAPRVFERFFKTDASRSSGGIGLGLAIARHIVEAHGGEISLSSVEGRGSAFSFTLMVAEG
ncbi:MAG: ATP-binding protein [Anaerolineae bacterium]|jgi:two-component system phosphate regulon sensor histidine kinase PhoR